MTTIGILGAGQLGRMLCEATTKLGFATHVFAPDDDPIAATVATHFTPGEYRDTKALQAFADSVDVITLEFENVPVGPLQSIRPPRSWGRIEERDVMRSSALASKTPSLPLPHEGGGKWAIYPSPAVLETTQHRVKEKQLARSLGIGTAPFMAVTHREDLERAMAEIGTPGILKTCTMGYDGKGQWKIQDVAETGNLKAENCIYEGFVPFEKEISVIVARSVNGEMQCFEPVENVHRNHILHTTTAPANITKAQADEAMNIATKLAIALDVVGLLAVELFVTTDDILVNEMAPRPHNSGHWTMDGCNISQFEQAIRAVTGMPLIPPKRLAEKVVMTNLIGEDIHNLDQWKGAHIHIYGKKEIRPGRKMGHVNSLTLNF